MPKKSSKTNKNETQTSIAFEDANQNNAQNDYGQHILELLAIQNNLNANFGENNPDALVNLLTHAKLLTLVGIHNIF